MRPLSVTAVSFTALAAVSLGAPAFAETAAESEVEVDTTVTLDSDTAVSEIAASDPDILNGREITTYHGDRVGEVSEVRQDPRDDQIYVVVDADDFFEEDINDVMIPVDELSLHSEDKLMMSQGMEDRLKEMVFDEEDLETLSD